VHRVLILGAGKIGRSIARLLAECGDYDVLVGDMDERALAGLRAYPRLAATQVDVRAPDQLLALMAGRDSVVSACSYAVNALIAHAALRAGCSYFDLTEDIATTQAVRALAAQARLGQVFMPQCGLAPGFISIAGHALTAGFDRLDTVQLRVGALPLFPTNELKYNLTWSTDGLVNEYCNPCEVIHEGRPLEVLPLEGLEHFSLDGVDYEAFNTSGGVGTLWETLHGRVRTLDYKTVRYRGHRDLIQFLARELRLADRRDVFKDILEQAVPSTYQDVVLIFCTVTGWTDGRLIQATDARKAYHAEVLGEQWSAIQITTAASACAALELHREGALPTRGFVTQESIPLDRFLANRFGRCYDCGWHDPPARCGFSFPMSPKTTPASEGVE